jgi:hypothetical protein
VGYNKTVGKNAPYVEDPHIDEVIFQKNIERPIWRSTKHTTTLPYRPMSSTYKNTSGMLRR